MIAMVTYGSVTDMRAPQEPIHVTGIGVVSSFGDSREGFRESLLAGRSGIAACPKFESAGCRSVLAARVSGFDPTRWVSPMKLRRMDDTGPFALAAIRQAIDDARYAGPAGGDDRAGVVLGTFSAGGQATDEYLRGLNQGGPAGVPALLFNSTVANAAAGLAGLEFRLRGPNATISHKEASGLAAITTAADLLRAGRADALAAGGIDAVFELFFRTHDCFRVMNSAKTFGRAAAPFDRCRQGFVLGEGGFVLWLERGDAWRGRGAHSYGEILGLAAAGTTVPLNAWPDRPEPLVRTMSMALEEAGLQPHDIDVVYASANASRALDEVEAAALTTVFRRSRKAIITAIKGAIGECGASGSASCAAALLCGRRVPPIAGFAEADAAAEGLDLARSAADAPGPHVLVNSFASGGALFSAVLRVN